MLSITSTEVQNFLAPTGKATQVSIAIKRSPTEVTILFSVVSSVYADVFVIDQVDDKPMQTGFILQLSGTWYFVVATPRGPFRGRIDPSGKTYVRRHGVWELVEENQLFSEWVLALCNQAYLRSSFFNQLTDEKDLILG